MWECRWQSIFCKKRKKRFSEIVRRKQIINKYLKKENEHIWKYHCIYKIKWSILLSSQLLHSARVSNQDYLGSLEECQAATTSLAWRNHTIDFRVKNYRDIQEVLLVFCSHGLIKNNLKQLNSVIFAYFKPFFVNFSVKVKFQHCELFFVFLQERWFRIKDCSCTVSQELSLRNEHRRL